MVVLIKSSTEKALQYYYCSVLKAIKEGSIKGLHLKSAFQLKNTIDLIAQNIEKEKISDYEEVLKYGN